MCLFPGLPAADVYTGLADGDTNVHYSDCEGSDEDSGSDCDSLVNVRLINFSLCELSQ